jgi:Protein of unknown function (DUF4240)
MYPALIIIGFIFVWLLYQNWQRFKAKEPELYDELNYKQLASVKSDPTSTDGLGRVNEMLNEDIYWLLIDNSLKATNDQDEQDEYLEKAVTKLSPKEIIGFHLRTFHLLKQITTSEIWCAAYLMRFGYDEYDLEFFCSWIISKGKTVYYNAKENADSLFDLLNAKNDEVEYEYVFFTDLAIDAFQTATEKELVNYIDATNPVLVLTTKDEIAFNWDANNSNSMQLICPRLFDHWMKNR